MLDISITRPGDGRFCSENKVWDIGGILLSSVVAPATHVTRGRFNISRAPIDHWVITYNRNGTTAMSTNKGTLHAPPRVPFLWSLGDTTSTYRSDVDRIQLLLPRDMFRGIGPLLDASRGSLVNTPLGTMLGNYMLFLETHLNSVAENELPRLTGAVRSMVAACIAPSNERAAIAATEIEHSRRERICQLIHLNLRSRALGPAMICKATGISRSQLYRLFENAGGVLRYIQRQRLLLCHTILSDPENRKPILSVAADFGFADASSFRRAFRREFGHGPRDVKVAGEVGVPIGREKPNQGASATRRFYDLVSRSTQIA